MLNWFAKGRTVEITDNMSTDEYSKALASVPGLRALAQKHLKPEKDSGDLAMEFVLEGLHQASLIAREDLENAVSYKDMLKTMFESMETARGEE